ncbi:hypothetical protein [Parachitinimonas caeni]|uniref:Transmembrane protein n=1 Tax=Parachitinimonas caeni TaxID=3031301 RepID=A0ABT7E068_9NEIS|nr:hypothetical protein [Parachitinimonas caeni]MDK2125469.1 hypothetical protein [Parachitinimonas caeni]
MPSPPTSSASAQTAQAAAFELYERRLSAIEAALADAAIQRESQQKTLSELTEVLHDLRDLMAAWETTRGAFHVLRALGNAARWLVTVGAAAFALWLWFKNSLH